MLHTTIRICVCLLISLATSTNAYPTTSTDLTTTEIISTTPQSICQPECPDFQYCNWTLLQCVPCKCINTTNPCNKIDGRCNCDDINQAPRGNCSECIINNTHSSIHISNKTYCYEKLHYYMLSRNTGILRDLKFNTSYGYFTVDELNESINYPLDVLYSCTKKCIFEYEIARSGTFTWNFNQSIYDPYKNNGPMPIQIPKSQHKTIFFKVSALEANTTFMINLKLHNDYYWSRFSIMMSIWLGFEVIIVIVYVLLRIENLPSKGEPDPLTVVIDEPKAVSLEISNDEPTPWFIQRTGNLRVGLQGTFVLLPKATMWNGRTKNRRVFAVGYCRIDEYQREIDRKSRHNEHEN